MGFLDGVDKLDFENERNPFLTDGTYILAVEELRVLKSKKSGQDFGRFTFKVIESTGEQAVPPGALATVLVQKQAKDNFGYYLKDIVRMVASILNENPKEVNNDMLTNAVNPDTQPLKGAKVRARAYRSGAEEGQKGFLKIDFSPYIDTAVVAASNTASATAAKKAKSA